MKQENFKEGGVNCTVAAEVLEAPAALTWLQLSRCGEYSRAWCTEAILGGIRCVLQHGFHCTDPPDHKGVKQGTMCATNEEESERVRGLTVGLYKLGMDVHTLGP